MDEKIITVTGKGAIHIVPDVTRLEITLQSIHDNYEKSKPPYQVVRTYRNDVAPAYTWGGMWIFIDRSGMRCSEYEYISMDPVLRQGIYEVRTEKGYGAAY